MRRPTETPLYTLLDSLYEEIEGAWGALLERRYGFRRGLLDGVVARYLDCGIFERGFARIRCPDFAAEDLLAFSCKGRGLCPSCGANRAAEFAAFLKDEVVADVGQAQWVFTVPKLLRPCFIHHRQLLGAACAAAWQAVRELLAPAAGPPPASGCPCRTSAPRPPRRCSGTRSFASSSAKASSTRTAPASSRTSPTRGGIGSTYDGACSNVVRGALKGHSQAQLAEPIDSMSSAPPRRHPPRCTPPQPLFAVDGPSSSAGSTRSIPSSVSAARA